MKLLKLALVASSVIGALMGCSSTTSQQNNSKPVSSSINAVVSELSAEQQLDVLVDQYYNESLAFSPIMATYSGKNEFNDQFKR